LPVSLLGIAVPALSQSVVKSNNNIEIKYNDLRKSTSNGVCQMNVWQIVKNRGIRKIMNCENCVIKAETKGMNTIHSSQRPLYDSTQRTLHIQQNFMP